jgi:spermidine synthase
MWARYAGEAHMPFQRILPFIALISGWCGIAYELLYSRLLTTHLGDMFQVNAAILTSFLLGIGVGSYFAHRFIRHLWLIELLIGLYSLIVALTVAAFPSAVTETVLPALAHGRWMVALTAFFFALLPALLIGFSVPLFSLYARHHLGHATEADAFKAMYWVYNMGAAACVLAMEYFLLRSLGIRNTLLFLAVLNLTSGILLRRFEAPTVSLSEPEPKVRPQWLAALFIVSALSGLYQLFLLKVTEIVFGPFHENFALVLALVLGGISLGTWRAHRWQFRFDTLLFIGAAGVGASVFLLQPLVHFWSHLNSAFGATPLLSTLAKALVLTLMGLVPLMVFGATVPTLLGQVSGRRESGRLLGLSSFGNCLGYILAVFILYERLSYLALALIFPIGLWVCGFLAQDPQAKQRQLVRALFAPFVLLTIFTWSPTLLGLSYRDFTSAETLERSLSSVKETELLKKFDTSVSLVRSEGEEQVIINGYRSLVASRSGRTNISELIVGTAPALYAPKRERAMVLGVGTGITAGATAALFKQTDGVEISPAVVAALPRFAQNNLGLTSRPGFRLILDDGLTALARAKEHYDAIVNTVTSPLYFSSSKLYTREFFELVKSRLNPGGVYSMWFDSRVTPEGAQIIFATLKASFKNCHFVYLTPVYDELICSDSPLALKGLTDEEWPSDLKTLYEAHRLGMPLNEVFSYLALPRHRLHQLDWAAPVNTFDRPMLEFIMASASLTQAKTKPWMPLVLAGVDFTVPGIPGDPLDLNGMGKRCFVFRAVSRVRNPECDALMTQQGKLPLPLNYLELLLQSVDEDDAPRLKLTVAEQLNQHGLKDRALEIVEGLAKPLGGSLPYEEVRITLRLESGKEVSDAEVATLYRAGPLQPSVRRVIAKVAAAQKKYPEAIAHLDYLARLGGFTKQDAALREELQAKLQGVTQ